MRSSAAPFAALPHLALPLAAMLQMGCGSDSSDSDTNTNTSNATSTGAPATNATGATGATHSTGSQTGSTGDGSGVSYAADVAPIFEERCTHCHHQNATAIPNIADPFDPTNGLIVFANTWHEGHPETPEMNVVPGDPANSFLIQKISDPALTAGDPMPWSPDRVTEQQAADLRQWITDGAMNDAFYASNIQRIFGTPGLLGNPGGKCSYCHFDGGVEPNLGDPFDPENGVVNVAATTEGWTRVIPGDPDNSLLIVRVEATETTEAGDPMPKVYPTLTPAEIDTVTQWILDGAQNN